MAKKTEHIPTKTFLRNAGRSLARTWRASRFGVLLFAATSLLQIGSSVAQLYIGAQLINALVSYVAGGSIETTHIFTLFGLQIALTFLTTIMWRLNTFAERRIYTEWPHRVGLEFNNAVGRLSDQALHSRAMRKRLTRVQESLDWKPVNYSIDLLYLMQSLLQFAVRTAVIIALMPILLPVIILSFLPSVLVQRKHSALSWNIWGTKGDEKYVWGHLHNIIVGRPRSALNEVRVFGLRPQLIGKMFELQERFAREQRGAQNKVLLPSIAAAFAEIVVVGGIDLWLINRVLARDGFGIGDYNFYNGNVTELVNASNFVLSRLSNLIEEAPFINDYYQLLSMNDVLPRAENPVKLAKGHIPTIEFKNVTFRYPGATQDVFHNLSFTVRPGEKVALVGENGAGKTTLIKLLLRFYDINDGQILVDGHDIRTLDLESWYWHLGVLFQEFNRYPFDINENIALGRADEPRDKKRIKHAAKDAGITGFANELPHGLRTILDPTFEKGIEPSGGQWQRVALGRAFYRGSNILILDEPTAAVDAKAEFEIFNQINKTYEGKTSIIVSHRFSTVRTAHHIIVLKHGQIVEEGTHDALMHRTGLYHEMFTKQAAGYR